MCLPWTSSARSAKGQMILLRRKWVKRTRGCRYFRPLYHGTEEGTVQLERVWLGNSLQHCQKNKAFFRRKNPDKREGQEPEMFTQELSMTTERVQTTNPAWSTGPPELDCSSNRVSFKRANQCHRQRISNRSGTTKLNTRTTMTRPQQSRTF